MKAVKILGTTVLGLLGLAVLLYLIALAINWKDQPPSEDALAFQRLLDARPQVPDGENAYVYLLARYAYQVASAEGVRRAALLVAQLKAQGVPAGQVAPEVARSALRDPYTGSAFEWEANRLSLVFTGPEDHPTRRNEFFY